MLAVDGATIAGLPVQRPGLGAIVEPSVALLSIAGNDLLRGLAGDSGQGMLLAALRFASPLREATAKRYPAAMHAPNLSPTPLVDSDHPEVVAFARRHAVGADERARAVALYYAVRDGFRYDPYRLDLSPQGMRASTVLAAGTGWCVPKAALLAAACRAAGIAARLGYADVRNHLSTERMRESMGTDLFVWHGYTEILIEGRWRKATPAFNVELCERFGLLPLEFDGTTDSIYHPYDRAGNRHMEYVRERGSFDEVPLARIVADFRAVYPAWMERMAAMRAASFMADVERETA